MLEVQKLSKSYGKSLAVDEVSFFVPDGTVGILLGPNGAGKSTIIKSIAGLLRYQGRIGIQGLPARSVEAKRQFAYVPEMPAMFDALSVREHIEYMRKAYNSGITDEEVEALLARFDLDDKQDKLGNELSKGMMQKGVSAVRLPSGRKCCFWMNRWWGWIQKRSKSLRRSCWNKKLSELQY